MKKKTNQPRWPLRAIVEVEWRDSCSNKQWASLEQHRRDSGPSICRSVGYLLSKSATEVIVAQSLSLTTGHIADTMAIPFETVSRMRRLGSGW